MKKILFIIIISLIFLPISVFALESCTKESDCKAKVQECKMHECTCYKNSCYLGYVAGNGSGPPIKYGECGDNKCDYGENTSSYPYYCPKDCNNSIEIHKQCGNGICDKGESECLGNACSQEFCPQDCNGINKFCIKEGEKFRDIYKDKCCNGNFLSYHFEPNEGIGLYGGICTSDCRKYCNEPNLKNKYECQSCITPENQNLPEAS